MRTKHVFGLIFWTAACTAIGYSFVFAVDGEEDGLFRVVLAWLCAVILALHIPLVFAVNTTGRWFSATAFQPVFVVGEDSYSWSYNRLHKISPVFMMLILAANISVGAFSDDWVGTRHEAIMPVYGAGVLRPAIW